jgi:hypothetical protein
MLGALTETLAPTPEFVAAIKALGPVGMGRFVFGFLILLGAVGTAGALA